MIWLPPLVLLEANQSKPIGNRKTEAILGYATLLNPEVTFGRRQLVEHAAAGLRALDRVRCECRNHIGPDVVDSYVMAIAHLFLEHGGGEAVVYTSDPTDFNRLAQHYQGVQVERSQISPFQ